MIVWIAEVSHGGLKQMIPPVLINNKQDVILTGAAAPVMAINQTQIQFKQSRLTL